MIMINQKSKRILAKEYALSVLGAIIYAFMLNIFIQPLHLISGSITGIAQILASILQAIFHYPPTFNMTGILLFAINIPILFLATKLSNRHFVYKTILTIACASVAYSIIPVPAEPPIHDPLTACAISGLVGGFGGGLTLRGGGSGGGLDVIGLYLTKKFAHFSVGKVATAVSLFVYALTYFKYNFEIMIYSIIFTVITSAVVDRVHYQNVKVMALVITDQEDVRDIILKELNRTATRWDASGIYANKPRSIYLTVITKYEVVKLKRLIRKVDPTAFVIVSDNADILGNFQIRID